VRRHNELLEKASAQPLFVRTSHPEFLVARWQENFAPKDAEALCVWDNKPPPIYGRVNRLKIDDDKFLGLYSESRPVSSRPDFMEFQSLPTRALARGYCYVQDPSTAIACQLLGPNPGERVLDACAAPGGKTGYLAQLMENRGMIVACDRDAARLQLLKENVARLGTNIVSAARHDWTIEPIPKEIVSMAPFDRILVDAPCTNTGVIRRRLDVRWRLRPQDFVRMPQEQFAITRSAIRLLKPGGVLVYSTCSLEMEENEAVVDRLVDGFLQMRLESTRSSLPFRDHFDGAFAARLKSA
jgi:16S rRNA (cytosine967-C5)-methyltransferase